MSSSAAGSGYSSSSFFLMIIFILIAPSLFLPANLWVFAQLDTILVDDTNSSITYLGEWDHVTGGPTINGPYYNTTSVTTRAGSTFLYSFKGISIAVYGALQSSTIDEPATSQYFIDGVAKWNFTAPSFNGTYRYDRIMFFRSSELADEDHTLQVFNLRNGTSYEFDYLNVTVSNPSGNTTSPGGSKSSGSDSGSGSSNSSSTLTHAAIAGIVVGTTLGMGILIAALLLWRRHRRPQQLRPLQSRDDVRGGFDLDAESGSAALVLPPSPYRNTTFAAERVSSVGHGGVLDGGGRSSDDHHGGQVVSVSYPPAPPPSQATLMPPAVSSGTSSSGSSGGIAPSSRLLEALQGRHPYSHPQPSGESRLTLFGLTHRSGSSPSPAQAQPPAAEAGNTSDSGSGGLRPQRSRGGDVSQLMAPPSEATSGRTSRTGTVTAPHSVADALELGTAMSDVSSFFFVPPSERRPSQSKPPERQRSTRTVSEMESEYTHVTQSNVASSVNTQMPGIHPDTYLPAPQRGRLQLVGDAPVEEDWEDE